MLGTTALKEKFDNRKRCTLDSGRQWHSIQDAASIGICTLAQKPFGKIEVFDSVSGVWSMDLSLNTVKLFTSKHVASAPSESRYLTTSLCFSSTASSRERPTGSSVSFGRSCRDFESVSVTASRLPSCEVCSMQLRSDAAAADGKAKLPSATGSSVLEDCNLRNCRAHSRDEVFQGHPDAALCPFLVGSTRYRSGIAVASWCDRNMKWAATSVRPQRADDYRLPSCFGWIFRDSDRPIGVSKPRMSAHSGAPLAMS
nr:hypothetical protein CFP56_74961 [Quercus suber]